MSNMKYSNKTEGNYDIKAAGSDTKTFVLWREIIMAYVSPAIMAGIGGLVIADKGLQIAALTTIGGTSALVALMLGLWLHNGGGHKRWIIGAPHLVVVGIFALAGASLGLLAAWVTSGLLEIMVPIDRWTWVGRIWIDFPLSGFIASTIVTWRWRAAVRTHCSTKGEDKK